MGKFDNLRESINDKIADNNSRLAGMKDSDRNKSDLKNQNAFLNLIAKDLSDTMSDDLLSEKIGLIEKISVMDPGGKKITFKEMLQDSKRNSELDDDFLKTLSKIHNHLYTTYDTRKNHRYRMTAKYDEKTIKQSTVLRGYMETTKDKEYSNGSLTLDLTRGVKLQKKSTVNAEVQTVEFMLEEEVKKRNEEDKLFKETTYLFSRIKMITGEQKMEDKDAKKADVLNRFAHQMITGDMLNEIMNKFEVTGLPPASKKTLGTFFSSSVGKISSVLNITDKDHRVYLDTDNNRNYVEADLNISVIGVTNNNTKQMYYACFDANKKDLQWINENSLNSPKDLLIYKEPLMHVHIKAEEVEDPQSEGDYYLKIIAFDVESYSPSIKSDSLPNNIKRIEKDIPETVLKQSELKAEPEPKNSFNK